MVASLQLRRRLFARLYDRATQRYERIMRPRKRELLASLTGTVVELGPGTGASLELLPEAVRWIGIEPNQHMHPLLIARAESLGREIDLREHSAEALPLADASADAVLSTLVLCSVPDVGQVLAEVRRVLRPGGRYVFWEHVLAPEPGPLRWLQRGLTPLHRLLADGCRCDRDLEGELRRAGFEDLELEAFRAPREAAPAWVRPHVRGFARR